MTQPFVAEIRIFPYNFAPRGWAFCNGQIMPIDQNTALYSLLGTTYGGNGQTTFALPNMQGRVPMNSGTGPGLDPYTLGESAGSATITLTASEMPGHQHAVSGTTAAAGLASPANNLWAPGAGRTPPPLYQSSAPDKLMLPTGTVGGSQPHNNMQPFLCVNFCIALQGIYPARN
jgi:microcystin-dependent protein